MTAAITPKEREKQSFPATLIWARYALGFGLGGFFDGILLHQILQWHHLLSGIEEAR
jgi:Predicted membrane protein